MCPRRLYSHQMGKQQPRSTHNRSWKSQSRTSETAWPWQRETTSWKSIRHPIEHPQRHLYLHGGCQKQSSHKTSNPLHSKFHLWSVGLPFSIHPKSQTDLTEALYPKVWMGCNLPRRNIKDLAKLDHRARSAKQVHEASKFWGCKDCLAASLLWCEWVRIWNCKLSQVHKLWGICSHYFCSGEIQSSSTKTNHHSKAWARSSNTSCKSG